MDITLLAAIVIAVVLLTVVGFFLVRTQRPGKPGKEETTPEATGEAAGATAVEDRERDTGTVRTPPAQAPPATRPAEPAEPELESPPPSAGRMVRLRARLARSQSSFGQGLLNLLSSDSLDEDAWEEIEDTLITADIGVTSASQIVESLRTRVKVLGTRGPDEVRTLLREELLAQITTAADRTVHTEPHGDRPAVIMVVGVNGTGKTTTTGKLARALVGDGRSVVLGAADTFRAAASEQLQTWGGRVGAPVVTKEEGSDPASVAFDAVSRGIEDGADTVIIDTAGRLHTKTGLMDELGKVKRVVEKKSQVDEVLLVLDATTGQNGLRQARVFGEVVNVTGIALTKLDGTAKGGIIVQVQRELGVPVKLVGLGEGPDDLAPFDPEVFVDTILSED
ncbi:MULTISPECIES: signal recognition particle-docking protein FtsY [Nocardiopsis]|uniref:Signal recognition particle receptor FtsY n=1 Tax=Nocardiopsis sinuspersici TaxID=501010 RepID=A0A1V3BVN0_9ACTN|nr:MULTISPECIES: signal recognition particle-docking protein FtsY [Nocardiopsis]NYH53674.1 fused signal recognition particle receptor [Nocardiopsis sinuspersici]OOC52591.1 signal recognition particle-docking protein FtsY [Nocardiopsis sinuspersici]